MLVSGLEQPLYLLDAVGLHLVLPRLRGLGQLNGVLAEMPSPYGLIEGGAEGAMHLVCGPRLAAVGLHVRVEHLDVLGLESVETVGPQAGDQVLPHGDGAVQGMEARDGNGRRVADVMQHGGGLQQFRVVPQDRAQGASAFGDPERVRPPARQRFGQQRFREPVRPLSQSHGCQDYGWAVGVGRARTVRPLPWTATSRQFPSIWARTRRTAVRDAPNRSHSFASDG